MSEIKSPDFRFGYRSPDKPSSSESTRFEREWEKIRDIIGKRSPRINITYNRKAMNKIGSLSPDLLAKITHKQKAEDPNAKLSKRSS